MISLEQFQRALIALENQRIETHQRKAPFVVRVYAEGPEYVPESSKEPRPDSWTAIQKVLDRYNETGSLRPVDYHDVTFHSSYVLALLRRVLGQDSASEGDPTDAPRLPSGPARLAFGPESKSSPPSQEPSKGKAHQRVGAISNAHVGADFENVAREHFARVGIELQRSYPLEIGLREKKVRYFDLGSNDPKVLVECKSHTWTEGGRVPSAKMTVWNEAMYYFLLAPPDYRKILFVLHNRRQDGGESLLAYYKRTYSHMIPEGVEFLEWDESTGDIVRVV